MPCLVRTTSPTAVLKGLRAARTCFAAMAPSGRMGLSWSLVGPAVWLSACRIRIIRLQATNLRCVSGAIRTISTAARTAVSPNWQLIAVLLLAPNHCRCPVHAGRCTSCWAPQPARSLVNGGLLLHEGKTPGAILARQLDRDKCESWAEQLGVPLERVAEGRQIGERILKMPDPEDTKPFAEALTQQ